MSESVTIDEKFDRSNAACAKAIAKDAALSTRPDTPSIAVKLGMQATEIPCTDNDKGQRLFRGIGDSIAVVAAHHNADIHKRYQPYSTLAKLLFNEMERLRCESLGAHHRAGVAHNLSALWHTTICPHPGNDDHRQLKLIFSCLTRKALHQPIHVTPAIQVILDRWQETILNSTRNLWQGLFENQRLSFKLKHCCITRQ